MSDIPPIRMRSAGFGNITDFTFEPYEIDVPAHGETFDAQVLVLTRAYKKTIAMDAVDTAIYDPIRETHHVLAAGNYRLELVLPALANNGKPVLIIHEEEAK